MKGCDAIGLGKVYSSLCS